MKYGWHAAAFAVLLTIANVAFYVATRDGGSSREQSVTRVAEPDEVIGQANTKIRHVIEAGGGQLLKVENWGRRKLAYEVKKQLKGIYIFFVYLGGAGVVE